MGGGPGGDGFGVCGIWWVVDPVVMDLVFVASGV